MVILISDTKLAEIFPEYTAGQRNDMSQSITNMIQEYCNTTFEVLTYTDERQDSAEDVLLYHMPLVSVISLTDNDVELSEDVDFYVYPQDLAIVSPSGVRKGLTISYTAGYSEIPETVKRVAEEIAKYRRFQETEGNQLYYKRQVFEEREYDTNPDLNEQKILSKLRRWVQKSASIRGSSIRIGKI